MYVCVTADIERFQDGISKYGCHHKIDDIAVTRTLLDLFCEIDIPCTLFILGKFAHEVPVVLDMVRENGHEIASHGYSHVDLRRLPSSLLEEELEKSGLFATKGFRAPYYGLDKRMIEYLHVHFLYDSSKISVRSGEYVSHIHMLTESLMEIPISTIWGLPLTSTGLRYLPRYLLESLVRFILKRDHFLIINVHPWEFAQVSREIDVPPYVTKNTGPYFREKFCAFLKFLKELETEFITMEEVYERHRC